MSSVQWKSVGPAQQSGAIDTYDFVSGRVLTIAFSPDVRSATDLRKKPLPMMLIGTDGGGIWGSTNFLNKNPTWRPSTDTISCGNKTKKELLGLVETQGEVYWNSVLSIDVHPSLPLIAYAALGCGIMASPNGGFYWNLVFPNNRKNGVYAVEKVIVDPTDDTGQTVYALGTVGLITGFSNAIYKSTDGGSTWNPVYSPTEFWITDLDYALKKGNMIFYAALMDSTGNHSAKTGIHSSSNLGKKWNRINMDFVQLDGTEGGFSKIATMKLAADRGPDGQNGVFAAIADSSELTNVFASRSFRQKLGGKGGESFVQAGDGLQTFPTTSNSLAIGLSPSGTVYVGGVSADAKGLWQLIGGDGTWAYIQSANDNAKPHSDHHAWGFFTHPSTMKEIVFNGNDGGVWRFDPLPKGKAGPGIWTSLNTPNLASHLDYAVDLHPLHTADAIVASQDNGVADLAVGKDYRFWWWVAAGDSFMVRWDLDPNSPGQSLYYSEVVDIEGVGIEVHINRLDDDGTTTDITSPFSGKDYFQYTKQQYPFSVDPISGSLFLLLDKLYKSTDKGESWQDASPPFPFEWSESPMLAILGGIVWAGDIINNMFVSTTGGGTNKSDWKPVAFPYYEQRKFETITIDPADPTTAYIGVYSIMGEAKVFVAKNYGTSWQDITYDLPKIVINSIGLKPESGGSTTVFLGTDLGVWSQVENQTGSQSWEPFGQGLPDVRVTDLRYYAKQNSLVAATYGRGVFVVP